MQAISKNRPETIIFGLTASKKKEFVNIFEFCNIQTVREEQCILLYKACHIQKTADIDQTSRRAEFSQHINCSQYPLFIMHMHTNDVIKERNIESICIGKSHCITS